MLLAFYLGFGFQCYSAKKPGFSVDNISVKDVQLAWRGTSDESRQ
jgi:hypothetical protein